MSLKNSRHGFWISGLVLMLAILACNLPARDLTPAPSITASLPQTSETPLPVSTVPTVPAVPTVQLPYEDAGTVMAGICFSFLQTLAGQTVVLKSPAELAAFYDRVDKSKQCRDAVPRRDFDFAARQIVGTVAAGRGCRIDLSYDRIAMDANARQRQIILYATPIGDCGYELVRPIWLAITPPPADYTTQIQLTPAS